MSADRLNRPYADAALSYWEHGWRGIIPVGFGPNRKAPIPEGYTGYAGVDPSYADIMAWTEGREANWNIGLRIPLGVYVLDVDAHSDKPAVQSLIDLETRCGELPPTWSNTARGQDAVSRQHFFRAQLPEDRVWRDHPGPGLDSLHFGHRYAVVAPSTNPHFNSDEYCWYTPEGELWEEPPRIDELTYLPASWIEACSKVGTPLAGTAASDSDTHSALGALRRGSPCWRVSDWLKTELFRLSAATSTGAIHDPGRILHGVALGLEGHVGVASALTLHCEAYVQARTSLRNEPAESARADWWRQVRGAVGKLPSRPIPTECECENPAVGLIAPPEAKPEAPNLDLGTQMPSQPSPDSDDPLQQTAESFLSKITEATFYSGGLDDVPEAEPLIDGVLYLDSLAWLYGPPASFKSFLALDMAGSISSGRDWQGFPVKHTGTVLYVIAEGRTGLRKRVRAWEEHAGIEMENVAFLTIPIQAAANEQWSAFIQYATDLKPVLIVLDTQARMTAGMEENSAKEMGDYVRKLDRLRIATGACVFPLHHTPRAGGHMRGSIALDGAADTLIEVARSENYCTVTCVKQKDADEFEPFATFAQKVGDSIVLQAAEGSASGIVKWTKWPQYWRAWWDAFENEPVPPSRLIAVLGIPETTFYREIKKLSKTGAVEATAAGRSRTYRLLTPPPSNENPPGGPTDFGTASALTPTLPSNTDGSVGVKAVDTPMGVPWESHGSETPKLCDGCNLPLDQWLIDGGWINHVGC